MEDAARSDYISLSARDVLRLFRRDGDLDDGIRSKVMPIRSMMLSVPMPDSAFYLAEKVQAAMLSQVP